MKRVRMQVVGVLMAVAMMTFGLAGPAAAGNHGGQGGGPVVTGGLVNVTVADINVSDLIEIGDIEVYDLIDIGNVGVLANVQVPIGVAANVCPNVAANVLAATRNQGQDAECIADAESAADSVAFQRFQSRQTSQ